MDDNESECCFAPDASTNADRGATSKQLDASPFDEKMRALIEARVGKQTAPLTQMRPPSQETSVFDHGV